MNVKKFAVVKITLIVMSGMKNVLLVLLILSASSILRSQDSRKIGFSGINELKENKETSVPLYENNFKDYRKSLAIRHGIKWASVSAIPLTFFIMNNYDDNCEFLCAAVYIYQL